MKNATIYSVTGALIITGIALCSYMYFETKGLTKSKKVTLLTIDRLKEAHMHLSIDVSKSRMGTVEHYDDIKTSIRHLKRQNRKFNTSIFPVSFADDNNLQERIEDYKTLSEGKVDGIEAFKSINAVVHNAQKLIPNKVHTLIWVASQDNNHNFIQAINATNRSTHKFLNANGLAYKDELLQELPVLNQYQASLSGSYQRELQEYVSQIMAIVDRYDATLKAVSIANRDNELNILNSIEDEYVSYIDRELIELTFINRITYLVVSILMLGLLAGVWFIRDRGRQLESAEKSRETATQNYRDRTKQHFTTEPLAAFGEVVSGTIDEFSQPFTKTIELFRSLVGNTQALDPIVSSLEVINQQSYLTSSERDAAIINSEFNKVLRHYRKNVRDNTVSTELLNKGTTTASKAQTLLNRLISFRDMAASTRTEVSLATLVNDEADRLSELENIKVERNLVSIPKVMLNVRVMKLAIRELILAGIDNIGQRGNVEISTSENAGKVTLIFRFESVEALIDAAEEKQSITQDHTELLLSFDTVANTIHAQGGELSTTGIIDQQFTVTLEFTLLPPSDATSSAIG